MGFVNENWAVSSSVGSLWRREMKKGYDDKLMPFIKKCTQKVYIQQKTLKVKFSKGE